MRRAADRKSGGRRADKISALVGEFRSPSDGDFELRHKYFLQPQTVVLQMKLQIVSDLHLEMAHGDKFGCYRYDISVHADHLALLGDVGLTVRPVVRLAEMPAEVVQNSILCHRQPRTISILPHRVPSKTIRFCRRSQYTRRREFILLNRARYDISPSLTILGCTLWSALIRSDVDDLSLALLNDFWRIEGMTPTTYVDLHRADVAWLNTTITKIACEEPEREIVVFTHHAPTIEGTSDPKHAGQGMSSAFASELTGQPCWKSGKVKLWAFGHTHWCCDFERAGVRVYSNAVDTAQREKI
ncbi:hypothetical protein A0H81_13869 [Grifola frondosa]|uniref:Calcineurin-like phosphoesterase domain-containing protein n=1 Tax=Grifola frondosa TaxID=5627 RepID=A0A1C7LN83_GRIFR|nr:hypothetical protein A0H81_13869 [Grifola frondosa]